MRRGTSLVEVLVVLVILVLGIFSIARLFPGGFFVLRNAENNTFADRLAQSQLEALKQNNAFLLDAVYVYNPDGTLNPGVNLADLNNDYPSTAAPDAAYYDINKARYVSGESFTVPASGPNGVPIHVLNYGPAHIPSAVMGGAVPTPYVPASLSVAGFGLFSAPWTAQAGSSQLSPADLAQRVDNPADLLPAGKPDYLVDYANGKIALPFASYPQNFVLVVKTVATSTTPGGTYTIRLRVPASNPSAPVNTAGVYNGGWFAPGDTSLAYAPTSGTFAAPATGAAFVTGSAILTRPLTFVQSNGGQDTQTTYPNLAAEADPYTYELAVGATAQVGPTGGDEYMGVLVLNPRLSGQQVSASYLTVDWHIIHEDADVPAINSTFTGGTSVTNAPVRLTLNHLRRVGDVLPDQKIYTGLFAPPSATVTSPYDIVLVDTDTGQMQGLSATDTGTAGAVYDLDNAVGQADASGNPQGFQVSYQNGRVTLPAANSTYSGTLAWTGAPQPHRHLRVFYAGDYGWAVALQKNTSLYTLAAPGAALAAGQCAFDPANPGHLLFPVSDLGQTVNVHGITYTDAGGNTQQLPDVTGSTVTSDFAGSDYVNVGAVSGLKAGTSLAVGAVQGTSARAVVIWKERDQWKSRTIGTILNRS